MQANYSLVIHPGYAPSPKNEILSYEHRKNDLSFFEDIVANHRAERRKS
jgi:hypothetical protein